METTFLRTFLLVVDTGSMADAARRLDITPGAVAQQIRALEREMGTALVARAGRTVKPTGAGDRVLEKARELVKGHADLLDIASGDSLAGELRLGTITTALHSYVPEILKWIVSKHPQVRVLIRPGSSMHLYDQVLGGGIDAAFCIDPEFTLPKVLGWRLMREEPLVVLIPLRWAKRDPHELLRSEPFIRYDRSRWGGRQAEAYLRAAGIVPIERFALSSLTAIAMMVDRGLGVSLVPDAEVPLPSGLKIARREPPLPSGLRRVGLLWSRTSVRASLIQLVLDAIAARGR